MKFHEVYGFRLYATLAAIFLVVAYAAFGLSVALIFWLGNLWYIALAVVVLGYAAFSTWFFYRKLIAKFKKAIGEGGEFLEGTLHYDFDVGGLYLRLPDKDIPLAGLFTMRLYKKMPEGTKIAAYFIRDEQTALLPRDPLR